MIIFTNISWCPWIVGHVNVEVQKIIPNGVQSDCANLHGYDIECKYPYYNSQII